MQLFEHFSLKNHHTFHLDVRTLYWAEAANEQEVVTVLSDKRFEALPIFIIGGGSNLLFVDDYPGLMLHVSIPGIEVVNETPEWVDVRVGAGVEWDDFVAYSVSRGWSGVENLSGIPGNVGACPVQNIGAYGVEAKDVVLSVEAIDRVSLERVTFSQKACLFAYRDSVFKQAMKNKVVVCWVTFRLSRLFVPNLTYGDLSARAAATGEKVSLEMIRDIILKIRAEKLPDTHNFGNAGSFFMNPVITADRFKLLKQEYPNMPGWSLPEGLVKVPAAWLIEQTGWKGKSLGNAGVHPVQPLVLINLGNATAAEVVALSDRIKADVSEKFGLSLMPEVLYI